MDLGARIAAWRKAKGLSPRELAEAVDVTPAAVYQWEGSGKSKCSPSQETLAKVVAVFGITMRQFWGRVPPARAA